MDVLTAIRNRRSVRSYAERTIPVQVLERLRQVLRSAPSACNYQPWHFVFVMDPAVRRRLGELANGQQWIADAPLIVVGCANPDEAYPAMAGRRCSAEVDVAIALDHLALAAVVEGLGTCWIGSFDEGAVVSLLGVPAGYEIVAMMPVGYPSSPDLNHPLEERLRKPAAEIFSNDRYGRR
jgi:nitroreductase